MAEDGYSLRGGQEGEREGARGEGRDWRQDLRAHPQ